MAVVGGLKDLVTERGQIEVNESKLASLVKESENLLPDFVRSYEANYRKLY